MVIQVMPIQRITHPAGQGAKAWSFLIEVRPVRIVVIKVSVHGPMNILEYFSTQESESKEVAKKCFCRDIVMM